MASIMPSNDPLGFRLVLDVNPISRHLFKVFAMLGHLEHPGFCQPNLLAGAQFVTGVHIGNSTVFFLDHKKLVKSNKSTKTKQYAIIQAENVDASHLQV